MKKHAPLLFALALAVVAYAGNDAIPRLPAFESTAMPVGTIDLNAALKPDARKLAKGVYRLSPEWVGTLRDTAWTAKWKKEPGAPEPYRLNFMVVDDDGTCALMAATTEAGAMKWMADGFTLIAPLSTEEILRLKTYAEFEGKLGGEKHRMQRFICGTGRMMDLERKEYSAVRDVYSRNEDGTLTVRNVWAKFHIQTDNPPPLIENNPMTLTAIVVTEGVFSRAKPGSADELRLFPSEDEKLARIRARLDSEIEKEPEPLRGFLRAKAAGKAAYARALEKAKSSPDPKLFSQLMARTTDFFEASVSIKDLSPIGDWRPQPEFHANQVRISWSDFLPFGTGGNPQPMTPERIGLLRAIIMGLPELPAVEDSLHPELPDFFPRRNKSDKPRLVFTKAKAASPLAELILKAIGITNFEIKEPSVKFHYRSKGNMTDCGTLLHRQGEEKMALSVLRDRLLAELEKKARPTK